MIATILVALDGSPRAAGVFDAAAGLARVHGARLVLYRALTLPPDYMPADVTRGPDPLPQFLENEARAQLVELRSRAPEVPCEIRVTVVGEPSQAILAAGDSADADLIVLGSHGYHGWDCVLGTTAGKVANRALRNVMIIHERHHREKLGSEPDRQRNGEEQ
jgi:nucleotide-binding universal stress UspA family protein